MPASADSNAACCFYPLFWFGSRHLLWRLMAAVPYPIAYALIWGLSADRVVKHPRALQAFPEVNLIDFDTPLSATLSNRRMPTLSNASGWMANPGSNLSNMKGASSSTRMTSHHRQQAAVLLSVK